MAAALEIDLDRAPGLAAQGTALAGDLEEREGQIHEEVCVFPDAAASLGGRHDVATRL